MGDSEDSGLLGFLRHAFSLPDTCCSMPREDVLGPQHVKHVRSLRRADYFQGESGVADEEQVAVLAAARRGQGWARSQTRAHGAPATSSFSGSPAEKDSALLEADWTAPAVCAAVPSYAAAPTSAYDPRVCMSSAAAQQASAHALTRSQTGSQPAKRVSFPNIDAGQDGNGRHAAAGSTKQAAATTLQFRRAEAAAQAAKAEAAAAAAAAVEAAKVEAEAAAAAEAAVLKARAWAQAREHWTPPTANGISSGVPLPGAMPSSALSASALPAAAPRALPAKLTGSSLGQQSMSSVSDELSRAGLGSPDSASRMVEPLPVRMTLDDLIEAAGPISVTDKAALRELKSCAPSSRPRRAFAAPSPSAANEQRRCHRPTPPSLHARVPRMSSAVSCAGMRTSSRNGTAIGRVTRTSGRRCGRASARTKRV